MGAMNERKNAGRRSERTVWNRGATQRPKGSHPDGIGPVSTLIRLANPLSFKPEPAVVPVVEEVVTVQTCHSCGNEWEYNGENDPGEYATCPKCLRKTEIQATEATNE